MQKSFFSIVFFSAPISKFFLSFIILISTLFFLLLKLFCFNFSFLVFISFIFATQFFCFKCCFLFLFKALKVILLLIFFYFLSLLYINFVFSFQYVYQFVFFCCSAHFFPFHSFLCFSFFIATQLFSTSLMRFCYL